MFVVAAQHQSKLSAQNNLAQDLLLLGAGKKGGITMRFALNGNLAITPFLLMPLDQVIRDLFLKDGLCCL